MMSSRQVRPSPASVRRPILWLGIVTTWLGVAGVGCSDEPLPSEHPGAADARAVASDAALFDAAPLDLPADASQTADTTPRQPEEDAGSDGEGDDGGGAGVPEVGPLDADDGRLGPPYPIVLAHGFFGTDKFGGLDFATYFFGVKDDLIKHGEPWVETPAVEPFQNSAVRGAQLLAKIEALLAKTGHRKVVIIGHSQGGLDARWVASTRPDLVDAVVTFATPHKGSPVADVALGLVPWPGAQLVIDALVSLAGVNVWQSMSGKSSVSAAVAQLTTKAMDAFNAANPNQPGIAYYSLTGRSAYALAKKECAPDLAVDFIKKYDKNVDPLDLGFLATQQVIDGGLFKALPHDGLVRVQDARWGIFIGCVPADHLDEIGQLFGDLPGLINPFNHKELYRSLVAWLRTRGH